MLSKNFNYALSQSPEKESLVEIFDKEADDSEEYCRQNCF